MPIRPTYLHKPSRFGASANKLGYLLNHSISSLLMSFSLLAGVFQLRSKKNETICSMELYLLTAFVRRKPRQKSINSFLSRRNSKFSISILSSTKILALKISFTRPQRQFANFLLSRFFDHEAYEEYRLSEASDVSNAFATYTLCLNGGTDGFRDNWYNLQNDSDGADRVIGMKRKLIDFLKTEYLKMYFCTRQTGIIAGCN